MGTKFIFGRKPVISSVHLRAYPQHDCWWQKTGRIDWCTRELCCQPEEMGYEKGQLEPHPVQTKEPQSPACREEHPVHSGSYKLESISTEKGLGVPMDTKLNTSEQCTLATRKLTVIWDALGKVLPAVWRKWSFSSVVQLWWSQTWSIMSSSAFSGLTGESPTKGRENDERNGASLIWVILWREKKWIFQQWADWPDGSG